MLTRKQLWKKCKIINYNKNYNENNNVINNENNNDNDNDNFNNKIIKFIPNNKLKKKVRFSNIVYLTLIPTKDEINKLLYNFESKKNIQVISNKIATTP